MAKVTGYRCDQCKKQGDVLSEAWTTLTSKSRPGHDETHHICSADCLVSWAVARRVLDAYYRGRADQGALEAERSSGDPEPA